MKIQPLLGPTPSLRKPCDGQLFAAHEASCNMYYLCNQGALMEQRCPAGLHWNVDHCDWPAKSGCTLPETTTAKAEDEMVTEAKPVKPEAEKPMKPEEHVTVKPVYDGTGYKVNTYLPAIGSLHDF